MFPFKSFSFTATCPSNPDEVSTVSLSGPDLASGLQYGPTAGLPRLIDWFIGLQERSHSRTPIEGWRLSVGTGSQDLIWKVSRWGGFISVAMLNIIGCSISRWWWWSCLDRSPCLCVRNLFTKWTASNGIIDFSGVIPMFKALHCEEHGKWTWSNRVICIQWSSEVETDAHGVCSSSLRTLLENWPEGKSKPRIFYTVPVSLLPLIDHARYSSYFLVWL